MTETVRSHDIDANPTKSLFIYFLTKDIDLDSAIVDLVDNSVDGARRMSTEDDLSTFAVRLQLSRNAFEINDNCGGMSIETAKNYAFRFGRPEMVDLDDYGIGRFGVGMKRTLFKLGKHFTVESRSSIERFVVDVDVAEWGMDTGTDWGFDFAEQEHDLDALSPTECYTKITANQLYTSVAANFDDRIFIQKLRQEIESAHQQSLNSGLSISINGVPLHGEVNELLASDDIRSIFTDFSFGGGENPLTVKLYAGIGTSEPSKAGWYVFCNGRMILEADQSNVTGWKERTVSKVPAYHNQYSRFRGFVFFDSNDTDLLPYNTTKTGLDTDNINWRTTRQKMVVFMQPVLEFLNELDKETDFEEGNRPLTQALAHTQGQSLASIGKSEKFVRPAKAAAETTALGRITYQRPKPDIKRMMEHLGVTSGKEVGEETYDYYKLMEMDD